MSRDLTYLYSTPIDSPERLPSLPQHSSSSCLNHVFTHVAQEVAELLQQSEHFSVNGAHKLIETIAIRAIKPKYKLMITVESLTVQELQVLQLIVDGNSNSAIALKFHISINTVKVYVRRILKKLGVRDRTIAAIQALRYGFVR